MAPAIDTADVIVVGGGVAGLSTAMQLSRRGQRVLVVERERLGNGSTGRELPVCWDSCAAPRPIPRC